MGHAPASSWSRVFGADVATALAPVVAEPADLATALAPVVAEPADLAGR
jgi:hypothetical protein